MKRTGLVPASILLALAGAGPADADDFPTALRELQALRSVTEGSLSYIEYNRRLLDAKVIVDRYLRATAPRDSGRVAIEGALRQFLAADDAWRLYVRGHQFVDLMPLPATSPIKECPLANRTMETLWLSMSAFERGSKGNDMLKMLVPLHWSCASDQLGDAEWLARKAR